MHYNRPATEVLDILWSQMAPFHLNHASGARKMVVGPGDVGAMNIREIRASLRDAGCREGETTLVNYASTRDIVFMYKILREDPRFGDDNTFDATLPDQWLAWEHMPMLGCVNLLNIARPNVAMCAKLTARQALCWAVWRRGAGLS